MTKFEAAITSRRDDLRQRMESASELRRSLHDWESPRGQELARLIELYGDLLRVIERHARSNARQQAAAGKPTMQAAE